MSDQYLEEAGHQQEVVAGCSNSFLYRDFREINLSSWTLWLRRERDTDARCIWRLGCQWAVFIQEKRSSWFLQDALTRRDRTKVGFALRAL